MGEDGIRGGNQSDTRRRLTVPQAADVLGVTVDAIRSRIKRETIEYVREEGRVYVLLVADQVGTSHDQVGDQDAGQSTTVGSDPRDEQLEQLREDIAYLRDQLDQEREARTEERRRQDMIIAQLTQANAALARRVPELEAPETPGASETASEGTGEGMGTPAEALFTHEEQRRHQNEEAEPRSKRFLRRLFRRRAI